MNDPFLQALILVLLGIGAGLVGRRMQQRHFREYGNPQRPADTPEGELARTGLQRAVVIFLTAGVMLIVFGAGIAGRELLAMFFSR